jgi:hypothetical protein
LLGTAAARLQVLRAQGRQRDDCEDPATVESAYRPIVDAEDSPMTPRLITGEIDLARWQRLTAHLRINGKPLESVLLRLADEEREKAEREKADG